MLLKLSHGRKAKLKSIWENVQSMRTEVRDRITKELRELNPSIEVVGICASGSHWCRRPRWWWCDDYVARMDDETERTESGARHLFVRLPLPPLEGILKEGWAPTWAGNASRRFGTFTRSAPMDKEPSRPKDLATASAKAKERCA